MTEQEYQFPLSSVINDFHEWPIYKLTRDKDEFLSQVIKATEEKFISENIGYEDLANVLYQERIRLTETPWDADPPNEPDFWADIKSKLLLLRDPNNGAEGAAYDENAILNRIIEHYADEIVGKFNPNTYNFARRFTPYLFAWLLNASPKNRKTRLFWHRRPSVYKKVNITGNLDNIRNLCQKGTVVVCPTHFSNLDSILIGWVLDVIGLPPFTYGAGLNLFTIKFLSYFMSRLGAYKIDRRKKNAIYQETLLNYSSYAISQGAHSLFFPGGTRSRSGQLEQKLKLGLLSTAVDAQRRNFALFPPETAKKIFVVPAVINYHFVLEAKSLINQHLRRTGKELFLQEVDEFSSSAKILSFIIKLIRGSSEITVSFGPVLDVFGNEVDENGESLNHLGNTINLIDYFTTKGEFKKDKQRDIEYAKMLAGSIVEKYHTHNTAFSSHVLAFTAFKILERKYTRLDLFALLRLPYADTMISYNYFKEKLSQAISHLKKLNNYGGIQLSPAFDLDIDEFIQHGLKNMGAYHQRKPLILKNGLYMYAEDMKLLYYYHNRMHGYELEKYIA